MTHVFLYFKKNDFLTICHTHVFAVIKAACLCKTLTDWQQSCYIRSGSHHKNSVRTHSLNHRQTERCKKHSAVQFVWFLLSCVSFLLQNDLISHHDNRLHLPLSTIVWQNNTIKHLHFLQPDSR